MSLHRKITIVVLALYWPALFVFAHIPIPKVVLEADVSDKSLHFLAYLILTFLIWFAVHGDNKVNWRKAPAWWVLLLVVGYGVVDELLQGLVAGRSCDVRDFFVDVAGTLAGLILFSVFTFWPAALLVVAIFIFGITNVARSNVADLLPIASAFFYLFAYGIFTLLWLQFLQYFLPKFRSERISMRWVMYTLAGPVVLLSTVKMASLILGRMFVMQDMLVSAVGIGVVVAAAFVIAARKFGRASGPDIP